MSGPTVGENGCERPSRSPWGRGCAHPCGLSPPGLPPPRAPACAVTVPPVARCAPGVGAPPVPGQARRRADAGSSALSSLDFPVGGPPPSRTGPREQRRSGGRVPRPRSTAPTGRLMSGQCRQRHWVPPRCESDPAYLPVRGGRSRREAPQPASSPTDRARHTSGRRPSGIRVGASVDSAPGSRRPALGALRAFPRDSAVADIHAGAGAGAPPSSGPLSRARRRAGTAHPHSRAGSGHCRRGARASRGTAPRGVAVDARVHLISQVAPGTVVGCPGEPLRGASGPAAGRDARRGARPSGPRVPGDRVTGPARSRTARVAHRADPMALGVTPRSPPGHRGRGCVPPCRANPLSCHRLRGAGRMNRVERKLRQSYPFIRRARNVRKFGN